MYKLGITIVTSNHIETQMVGRQTGRPNKEKKEVSRTSPVQHGKHVNGTEYRFKWILVAQLLRMTSAVTSEKLR